jgi:surfeit locus 1 family protein
MPNLADVAGTAQPDRPRRRALPTLAMLAAVALFVAAGHWQQSRMNEKEALRAQFDAAANAAVVALAALPGESRWTTLRYREIVATGEYDSGRQILIDNKVHDGRAGYDVVAPLKLVDGRVVLVDRGWVAQGASRAIVPAVAPPAGSVTLRGRINLPVAGYFELKSEAPTGPVWQNLDPTRFAAATGIAVLPVVVEQTPGPTLNDGLLRDWPAPDFGVEKHWIYMMQWYAFAGLAVVLWAVLAFRSRR